MIICSIIGSMIGAGFASGQEIYVFFYRYGIQGFLGLLFCCILIGLVIYKTLKILLYNPEIKNYQDFLENIFNSKKIVYITNIIINSFLLITFYIMISGFGAYFEQEYKLNSLVGSIILAILAFFVLIKDIEGVTKVNSIVVPILILIIFVIGIKNINNISTDKIIVIKNYTWIIQSIIYCSYNMILLIPVLVGLKKYLKNLKQIKNIAIISSTMIFILATNIYFLLTKVNENIREIQMPAVYSITINYPQFRTIYGVAILLSIFTTAISIGISFLNNIKKEGKNNSHIVYLMCISSVLISKIGFSKLVKLLFPIFGYLGILQIVIIIKKTKFDKK